MTESTSNDSYRKMLKLVPSLPHISEAPMSTNFSQMIICIVGGMLCLIPLIFNTESDIEDSQLRESLPERLHRDSAAAVLTLIVPLLLDITTDLLKSCFTTPKEVDKKNLGQPGLLNNMENLLFLIGSSVVPITAFLSTNTKNWAYVYICCRECQYSLSGGAILISLCRYNAKYWPVSTTYLLVILLSSASVIGAFTSNNLIQKPRSQTTKSFQWASYYIFLLAAAIFTFCSLRWLTMSVPKLIKRWNPLLKVSPETSPKSGNTISGNTKESLLFPFLYVMISLVAIFTLFFMSNYYEGPHNFDVRAIFYHNLSFILYLLVITYGSVRMMKHEIVKGLVSNTTDFISII